MLRTTRRVLAGPLLVAAIGAGMLTVPAPAQATGSSATIRVSGTLKVRSSPSLSAKIVGSLTDNAQVQIDCVIRGQQVRGSVRTTTTWDRLSAGHYVPHAYVAGAGKLRRCVALAPEAVPVKTKPANSKPASTKPAPPVSSAVIGTVKSLDGNVNLRVGPSTAAAKQGTVANGSKVSLVCSVVGELVDGTAGSTRQWDRTADGRYLSHAYVLASGLKACKNSAPTPVSSGSLTTDQFIRSAVPGAQRGWREFGVPPSVTIAQAILESGWGRSGLAATDRNHFGIKCFSGRYGTIANGCHTYETSECTKAGNCYATSASFRTYASATDSFRDHGNFLRVNPRYGPAFAHSKDANRFIWAVWKAGYATDPNYYTKITGIMAAHQLYQYDTWK
jgi:flagellar protein FlgJ